MNKSVPEEFFVGAIVNTKLHSPPNKDKFCESNTLNVPKNKYK